MVDDDTASAFGAYLSRMRVFSVTRENSGEETVIEWIWREGSRRLSYTGDERVHVLAFDELRAEPEFDSWAGVVDGRAVTVGLLDPTLEEQAAIERQKVEEDGAWMTLHFAALGDVFGQEPTP